MTKQRIIMVLLVLLSVMFLVDDKPQQAMTFLAAFYVVWAMPRSE